MVTTTLATAGDGTIASLGWHQSDPDTLGRLWSQRLSPALVYPDSVRRYSTDLTGADAVLAEAKGLPAPLFVLPNGDGLPYGEFRPDSAGLDALVTHLPAVSDDLVRATGWLTLWHA